MPSLPQCIETEAELDEVMTRPTEALQAFVQTLRGPLVVLGAGGKMGPSLCVQVRRAAEEVGYKLDIIAVSRFSDPNARAWLDARRVQTLVCDLMDRAAVEALPDAEDIIYLVGLKFGTKQNPARTWAINTLVPDRVSERYAGGRMVALSTGNVYPLGRVTERGAVESAALMPLGEYANAAVARERIFEYGAQRDETRVAQIRLNYAVDLRYGVLVDLAQKIAAGEPVDVTMGYLNCIWQGDANEMIVRALDLTANPPIALNLTGQAVLSIRELAQRLGELMGQSVKIVGTEAETALLSNPARVIAALGMPATSLETMLRWTAHWVQHGGSTLNKPTHFEVRDGRY